VKAWRIQQLWPGATVAILASGPSMSLAVADQVRAAGMPAIVINTTHRLAPWAAMLYAADIEWWQHPSNADAATFAGLRVSCQQVPGVLALVRHGPVCLQLWQHGDLPQPESCRIQLNGAGIDIFQCHARLARSARPWMDVAPRLKPWGAWEFCLLDAEGNRLIFVQWAVDVHAMPDEPGTLQDPQARRAP